MTIRVHIQIMLLVVARLRGLLRLVWPGMRPTALGEQEIKDRAGFPFSLRREAFKQRKPQNQHGELPTPLRIRAMCRAKIEEVGVWFRGRAAALARTLAAHDLSAWSRRFGPVLSAVFHRHAIKKSSFISEAGNLERAYQEAQDALEGFKAEQGIERGPIEPTHRALPAAVIFALVTMESVVSAPLFGRVSDYGDIGGFFLALGFSVLPPLLGICAGFFGVRMVGRKQARFRLLGGSIVLAVTGKMSVYGLIVAHYRFVLSSKPTATLADALSSLASAWPAFTGSFEACGLLALSVGAFGLGLYEGARRLADPIWGYSALQQAVDEAEANLEAADAAYGEEIEGVGETAVSEIDAIEKAAMGAHKRVACSAEQLVSDHDHAESVVRMSLSNCETVLGLCNGELRGLGWTGQPIGRVALPAPLGALDGGRLAETIFGDATTRPAQLLGGILKSQRNVGAAADQSRAEIKVAVQVEMLAVPALRRKIAAYVRSYLDTPLFQRGVFDPVMGVGA